MRGYITNSQYLLWNQNVGDSGQILHKKQLSRFSGSVVWCFISIFYSNYYDQDCKTKTPKRGFFNFF